MQVVRSTRTYVSIALAKRALAKTLEASGLKLDDVRWLIAVSDNAAQTDSLQPRYVPVLVGENYIPFATRGIQVVS